MFKPQFFTRLFCPFFFLCAAISIAQIQSPVSWKTSVEKVTDDTYDLIATATVDDHWHIYSQKSVENGPIPTTFSFANKGIDYMLSGTTSEPKGITKFEKAFDTQLTYFEGSPFFKQRVKILKAVTHIKATVEFMVCNDGACLPPDEVDLVFNLQAATPSQSNPRKKKIAK